MSANKSDKRKIVLCGLQATWLAATVNMLPDVHVIVCGVGGDRLWLAGGGGAADVQGSEDGAL